MTLEFTVSEKDFFEYYVYAFKTNPEFHKKRRRSQLIFSITSLFFAGAFYFQGDVSLAIYFLTVGLIIAILYPKYFDWYYKRHYKKRCKILHPKMFQHPISLVLEGKELVVSTEGSETKISTNEIERVNETKHLLLIRFNSESSLIIPKAQVNDLKEVKKFFQELKISLTQDLSWEL